MISPKFNKSRYGLDMEGFWSRDMFRTIADSNIVIIRGKLRKASGSEKVFHQYGAGSRAITLP